MKTTIASILILLFGIPLAVAANDSDSGGVADAVELADGTNPNNSADWKPFSQGLLLCYPFEGNANDTSGNGGNATLSNGPAFVAGVRVLVLSFDGLCSWFLQSGEYGNVSMTNP